MTPTLGFIKINNNLSDNPTMISISFVVTPVMSLLVVKTKMCCKTPVFLVSLIYYVVDQLLLILTFSVRKIFIQSISKLFFTDSDQDCLQYEALGEWSELVQDANGRALYRTWNFVDRVNGQETYIKYPSDWRGYFCRPIMYPKTPLGRFFPTPVDQL